MDNKHRFFLMRSVLKLHYMVNSMEMITMPDEIMSERYIMEISFQKLKKDFILKN